MVINVVVKTAIYFLIYLFTYLFIGKFVSGAWLKLFFEALCFGLRQTQKKKEEKKGLYLQKALSSIFQSNFKQCGANFKHEICHGMRCALGLRTALCPLLFGK